MSDKVTGCTGGYVLTDIDSPEYKNHHILLENIDILKKEISELKDSFIKSLSNYRTDHVALHIKISELEKDRLDHLNPTAFVILKKRCDNLEELIYEFKSQLRNQNRTPHRCPCCEGSGRYQLRTALNASDIIDCHACEGSGIVWS